MTHVWQVLLHHINQDGQLTHTEVSDGYTTRQLAEAYRSVLISEINPNSLAQTEIITRRIRNA